MKDLKPVLTTFSKRNYPVNLLTVPDWRRFAKEALGIRSYVNAAKKYAELKGGAFIIKADGKLVVLTRLQDGKIRTKTFKDREWIFEEY